MATTLSAGYSLPEAVFLMTLSGYAYIDRAPLPGEAADAQQARMRRDIDAALAASPYADWRVIWGPGLNDDRSNMMYVAGNEKTQQCAAVVRGTDWSFWLDWIENLGVLNLVPFPYADQSGGGNGGQIALGTFTGLEELTQMAGRTATDAQLDLVTFLQQLGWQGGIFVTGHSLGGCLASVAAPWLAHVLGDPGTIKVYTFAAPSAGNAEFAGYYNQLFTDTTGQSRAFRVYNTLDIVPDAWATLPVIEDLYVPSPRCTDEFKLIIGIASNAVGAEYRQVGNTDQHSTVPLTGHVGPPPSAALIIDPGGDARFLDEVALQHATATYMSLLGAPPVRPAVAKLRGMVYNLARS